MQRVTPFHKAMMASALILVTSLALSPLAHALKLSDLIKQTPQLYLPSQIIPGKTATFTIKAKPGQEAELILSSESTGSQLPNGTTLRAGHPTVEKQGVIPASGVLEIPVQIPNNEDLLGDQQFVEAIVWSAPDKSDSEEAQMIEHTGLMTEKNVVVVGTEPDGGNLMLLPGDSNVSSVLRSVNTLNDVRNDPRKKQLLDDGRIDRSRQIDQNLYTTPGQ